MSLRPVRASAPVDARLGRIQREHELSRTLEAARTLQARLELLGDRAADARSVHRLRDDLADELARLDYLLIDDVQPTPNREVPEGDHRLDAQVDGHNDVLISNPPYTCGQDIP